ncbi:Protein kinase of the Mitotic Exit Network [Balamuthia mandrillaris]
MSGQTPAADIWSLGCTLLEMLTGEPPYYSLPPMTAIFKIVQDDCPPLPDELTEDLHDFLTQCFEKDVNKRPSAKQLLQHEWLQKGKQNSSEKSSLVISLDEDVGDSLKKTVEELKKLEPSYSPASSMNNSKSDTMAFNGLESINMDYLDSLAKDVEKDQQKETSTNEKKEETENLNKQVKRAIRELDEKLEMIHSRLEKLKEESKAMVTLGRLYGTKMNFSHIRNSLRQQNVSNENEATIATKEEKNLMQGQVQEDLQRKREMTQRYLAYKTKIESQILNLKACMYQKATALRDFDDEGEGEAADRDRNSGRLSFKKGDVIYVHHAKTELKMWKGELLDKKGQWMKGYFPSDFVQIEPQKQSQQRINRRRASNIGGEMSFASSGIHRRTQPAEEKEKETKKAGEAEGKEGEEKKRKEELHSSEKKKEGKKEKKQKKEKKDEKKKKKNTLKKMVSFHKHQHSSNDSIKETKEADKEGRKEGEKEGEKELKDGNISLQVKEEGGAQRVTISKQFSNKAIPLSPLAEKQKSLDDAHQILSQVTEESGRDTAAFQEQADETNNITKTSHQQPTDDEPRTKKHNQTMKPETTMEELRQRIKALEAKDKENQRLISALQEENQRLRSLLGHPS